MADDVARNKRIGYVFWAAVALVVFGLVFGSSGQGPAVVAGGSGAAGSMAQRYPGPWSSEFKLEIARTLAKNQVRGCGEFYYRAASGGSNEYLVYCTRDGNVWSSYLAFTSAETVMGPYGPDASLPLPGR